MSDLTDKTQVSLRVPTSIVEAFERIAKALDRDRTWVMLRAFSQYLKQEGADVLSDAEGLEELDRGEWVDFESVMDEAKAIVAASERKRQGLAG